VEIGSISLMGPEFWGYKKVTLGITALLTLRVLINGFICDLDVELSEFWGAVFLKFKVCSTI